jgi:hypothetical protein
MVQIRKEKKEKGVFLKVVTDGRLHININI